MMVLKKGMMNTIYIEQIEGVWYVKQIGTSVAFPAVEGDLRHGTVPLDLVGSRLESETPIKQAWRTSLFAVEVAMYLASMQKAEDLQESFARWSTIWATRKLIDEDRFPVDRSGNVNVVQLRLEIDSLLRMKLPSFAA